MNAQPYIIDATLENFAQILERSQEIPVLVDFWAEWCGPCRSLLPVVTRLAEEYQGKFLLAKVNIDQQQELAMQFGVRSVPTVKLFRNGAQVDEFMGAQPESVLRAFLEPHLARPADEPLALAHAALERGDGATAVAAARQALAMDPDYSRAHLVLAEALLQSGELQEASTLIDQLPVELMADPAVARLRAQREFLGAAGASPDRAALEQALEADPGDSAARYQLGARLVLAGDYGGALEQFLTLLRRDRSYGDDAARKGMVAIFELLGNQGPLVSRYRTKMAQALF